MGTVHRIATIEEQEWRRTPRTSPTDNVLRVLRHLQVLDHWHSVPELAVQLTISHQTLYPLMGKLVRHGFVKAMKAGGVMHYLASQTRIS